MHALRGISADAVIHELTALKSAPARHGGMVPTDRLPIEGTADLLVAADVVGATTFVTQSIIMGYGYRDHGDRLLTEDDSFGQPAGDANDPHIAAMLSTEQQAFTAPSVSRCATGCSTAATSKRNVRRWPSARFQLPAADCSGGSITRTPPSPPLRRWNAARPATRTTSSMTGPLRGKGLHRDGPGARDAAPTQSAPLGAATRGPVCDVVRLRHINACVERQSEHELGWSPKYRPTKRASQPWPTEAGGRRQRRCAAVAPRCRLRERASCQRHAEMAGISRTLAT